MSAIPAFLVGCAVGAWLGGKFWKATYLRVSKTVCQRIKREYELASLAQMEAMLPLLPEEEREHWERSLAVEKLMRESGE